jgi:hypothetical protein
MEATAAVTPAPEVKVDGDKVTVGEVVADAGEVASAVAAYRAARASGDSAVAAAALLVLLTVVFKFLLSAVKLSGPMWKGRKGKSIMRLITITLGVASFFVAMFGGGMGWFEAFMVGLSGPLAVALHEYSILIPAIAKKKDQAKADA